MLKKAFTIARTNVYITYSDRGALIFLFLAPVLLSFIIGLAFGGGDNNFSIEQSKLLILNQDEGISFGGQDTNIGELAYLSTLIHDVPPNLAELLSAELVSDEASARAAVNDGQAQALLIIPPDFTRQVIAPNQQGRVKLYYNPGDEVKVSVVSAVVDNITSNLNAGQVARDILSGAAGAEASESLFTENLSAGIRLHEVSITGAERSFDSLQYFAPGMAIMFMTFAMAAGTKSILDEQRDWTLQRLMTTPTPRWVYMLGKLMGVFASGLIQMILLYFIISALAALMGRDIAVWGTNYLGLALLTIGVVGAATGLGLVIAAVSKTPTQADNIASAVLIVMAMIGGSFIQINNVPVLNELSQLTLTRWSIDGFTALSADAATVSDLLPNIGVLLLMTLLFFGSALTLFNKRMNF